MFKFENNVFKISEQSLYLFYRDFKEYNKMYVKSLYSTDQLKGLQNFSFTDILYFYKISLQC